MLLAIKKIERDPRTQPRVCIDQETLEEYAEALKAGCSFPPIIVFRDRQGRYWLADGWHRIGAYLLARRKMIECDVRQGELRDAILFAVGTNQRHGLRRTNADKRRAVRMLLADPEWAAWSNRQIAEQCGVSPGLVDLLRREQANEAGAYNRQLSDKRPPLRSLPPREQAAAINAEEDAAIIEYALVECDEHLAAAQTSLEEADLDQVARPLATIGKARDQVKALQQGRE